MKPLTPKLLKTFIETIAIEVPEGFCLRMDSEALLRIFENLVVECGIILINRSLSEGILTAIIHGIQLGRLYAKWEREIQELKELSK